MERATNTELSRTLVDEAQKAIESGKKTPRQVLEELAKTHLFLFHGSATPDIEELEPRQAINFGKPDGDPAVFATRNPDDAILMAIVSGRATCGITSKPGKEGNIYVAEKKGYIANVRGKNEKGYIYVLNGRDLKVNQKRGYTSEEPVIPMALITVTENDLPEVTLLEKHDYEAFWKTIRFVPE